MHTAKKALASLCINDERGTGFLRLGENNSDDYSYLNLNYLTFSHNSNYTATLGGSSFGYLRLYNNQGKENVALGVVEGSENNAGWKASFYIGTAMVAGSIPLFVLARRQKRAAQETLSLSMGSTVIQTFMPSGRIGSSPAWALRVSF